MPQIRVVTWNSTGEDANKAAHLANVVNQENAAAVGPPPSAPVTLVVIQEGAVANGALYAALNDGAPFNTFVHPPETSREGPQGGYRMKRYLLGWETAGAFAVTAPPVAAALQRINLSTDPGIVNYINNHVGSTKRQGYLTALKSLVRPPVWRQFTVGGRTVTFVSWHAPLGSGLPSYFPDHLFGSWSQGYRDAFVLWENSNWYATHIHAMAAGDIAILAGDMNAYSFEINRVLNGWIGVNHNLTHILAYTPAGNSTVAPAGNWANPPGVSGAHSIVCGLVSWP